MKPQNPHAHEDRLLDFAYGELSAQETRAVQSHLEGCPRCSEALASIRGVRSAFSQLGMEPAPEAGLDSLLAYAQQSARGMAQGPSPKQSLWRRLTVPVMGIASVCVFGLITLRVSEQVNLQPEFAQAQKTVAAPMAEDAPPPADLALPSAAPVPGALAEPQMPQSARGARRESAREVPELKKKMEKADWALRGKGGTASKAKERLAEGNAASDSFGMAADDEGPLPPPPAPVAAAAPMPLQEEADTAPEPAPYGKDAAYGAPPSSSLRLNEERSRQSKSKPPASKPVASVGALSPAKQAPSETEMSQQATVARQDNKRVLEASLLREALADGATGEERWSLLARLCDAEFALGRRAAAIEACSLVLKEAPDSPSGQQARRRLLQEAPAQPGKDKASAPVPAP
ncbi:zf-HC2 domain-containing protein [Stigmatella erecta]|uniref:Putative zinc-finger n=1 Tax=Stigmatella erecta TaxID=83460 RepID=A0A1I0K432_9BACT|nr:zf-HC2 domain-containing protein [Stigmatella erecta]SEU18444.1 Putative zinc-finger [Stigmatella erecta]